MTRPAPTRYRTLNWPAYNAALREHGSLTVGSDRIMTWDATPSGRRGGQQAHSDEAIQTCLTIKFLFGLPLRQTAALVESLLRLARLNWAVPDYSTQCQQKRTLAVRLPYRISQGPLHLLVDSTGIKIRGGGGGEWHARKHGSSSRRVWRKVHVGIDEATMEVRTVEITGSHVGDAPVMPDLISQIPAAETIGLVTADGADDTRRCHDAITGLVTCPPRKSPQSDVESAPYDTSAKLRGCLEQSVVNRIKERSMITRYTNDSGQLRRLDGLRDSYDGVVWIDLMNPSDAEEDELEKQLGINIPTKDEMDEIEISSRLYTENGTSFMTAILPSQADGDDHQMAPVSFVLAGDRLITVRYHEPRAFQTFPTRAEKTPMGCETGEGVLLALLEAIVDRLADILERAGREIDVISQNIFQHKGAKPSKSRDFQQVLVSIGRKGDLTSNIRESLVTLERLIGFLGQDAMQRKSDKNQRERIKTLSRDVRSLADHDSFLSQKITFLLDATLGMISIEQNAIIKIFSVAAVVFLPPTLIASIYGMNFEHMPELMWPLGYPFAVGLMVLSAILPYFFFKRQGWL